MLKKSSVSDTMSSYTFYSVWDVADFSEVQAAFSQSKIFSMYKKVQAGEKPGSKHPSFEMYAEVYVGMRAKARREVKNELRRFL